MHRLWSLRAKSCYPNRVAVSSLTGHPFSATYEELEISKDTLAPSLVKTSGFTCRNSAGCIRAERVHNLHFLGPLRIAMISNVRRNEWICLDLSDGYILGTFDLTRITGTGVDPPVLPSTALRFHDGRLSQETYTSVEGFACTVARVKDEQWTGDGDFTAELTFCQDLELPVIYRIETPTKDFVWRYRGISASEPSDDLFDVPEGLKRAGLGLVTRLLLRVFARLPVSVVNLCRMWTAPPVPR